MTTIPRIVVTVTGGVAHITEKPAGVIVIVRDYDTEGCDADRLHTDADGDTYTEVYHDESIVEVPEPEVIA